MGLLVPRQTAPSLFGEIASCSAIIPGCPQAMPENCAGELSMDSGVTELYALL